MYPWHSVNIWFNFSILLDEAVSLKSSQATQRKPLIGPATTSPELIKVKQMWLVFSYHFALTNYFMTKKKLLCISIHDITFQPRDYLAVITTPHRALSKTLFFFLV